MSWLLCMHKEKLSLVVFQEYIFLQDPTIARRCYHPTNKQRADGMFYPLKTRDQIHNVYVLTPPIKRRSQSFPGVIIAVTLLAFVAACGGSSGSQPTAQAPIVVATPSISIPTGTYIGTQQVTVSDSTSGSTIYYTTNGAVPTSSSTAYLQPISITVTSTVQAVAVLSSSQSAVAKSTLTII